MTTTPALRLTDDDAARKARQLVGDAVRAAVPANAMVERRIRPGSDHTWPEPTPLAGLRAAQQVIRLAEHHLYGSVAGLRAEGTSWRDVADLLEIPWSGEYSRVERAFELTAAAIGHDSNWSGLRIYWYCGGPLGCGQHITDRGPYDGHPSDCEAGHADDCRRLAAESAAHDRACEEAEERAKIMDEAYAQLAEHSFERATADRACDVLAHGGRYRGWSTSETLAVALVLNDAAELKRLGYTTRASAIDRVFNGNPPPGRGEAWLALVRAAATGEPTSGKKV